MKIQILGKAGIVLFLFLWLFIANSNAQTKNPPSPGGKFQYEIFQNQDKSYGYKILTDNKVMINQPSMPALPGNSGFMRKKDAERMADLVIKKIKQGIMPPTVSVREVDSVRTIKP